jgi:hypothetical protein
LSDAAQAARAARLCPSLSHGLDTWPTHPFPRRNMGHTRSVASYGPGGVSSPQSLAQLLMVKRRRSSSRAPAGAEDDRLAGLLAGRLRPSLAHTGGGPGTNRGSGPTNGVRPNGAVAYLLSAVHRPKAGHRFGAGWARPSGRLFTPAHRKPQEPRPGRHRFGVELLSGRVALRSARRLGVPPNGKPTP